jgi:hypothetical protein
MALNFRRGDPANPRGHAFVYFTDASDMTTVAATYVIVLPVEVDFAKYMPPFLAGQVPNMSEGSLSCFAFPPAPEKMDDLEALERKAAQREDDLIDAGSASMGDVMHLMTVVGEIVDEYAALCEVGSSDAESVDEPEPREALSAEVDDVVYSMMSEADQLGELTKLVGRLRYATEGGDGPTGDDSAAHIRALGRHMPENRQIDHLLEAARSAAPNGATLAQLYLERAYSLLREDYLRVKAIDEQIKSVRTAG